MGNHGHYSQLTDHSATTAVLKSKLLPAMAPLETLRDAAGHCRAVAIH